VRQKTLLNLGRHFTLPKEQWPDLCSRIDSLLSGQETLLPAPPSPVVEELAGRYAARLISATGTTEPAGTDTVTDYREVDVASLQLVRPRSVGVEHAGLAALRELGLPEILESAGLNGVQQAAALGNIIGRMTSPGSERATWLWLTRSSALGELLEVDFEAFSSMRLYRTSDLLVCHRETIEKTLFSRIQTLFSLPATVTVYDLTNTYFEGEAAGNGSAMLGHSKEKQSGCPLVTLALMPPIPAMESSPEEPDVASMLDGSGFVRRSRMFEGNVSLKDYAEGATLESMLTGLGAPPEALVIMDRGIATAANVVWLREHNYRYLVMSKESHRQFDEDNAVETLTASHETIRPKGLDTRFAPVRGPGCVRPKGLDTRFAPVRGPGCVRSLKSELGLRPVYHHREARTEGHLFITVLAYQAVQALRQKLEAQGIHESWASLRKTFSTQHRVTATFKQRDGKTLHIRKTTVAEPELKKLYDVLGISSTPGKVQKLVV
jgi:hypothetical protein